MFFPSKDSGESYGGLQPKPGKISVVCKRSEAVQGSSEIGKGERKGDKRSRSGWDPESFELNVVGMVGGVHALLLEMACLVSNKDQGRHPPLAEG